MSTVLTDTIKGKTTAANLTIGSTPIVSSSANSMTIRGEGSAQTSIQQGLAKVWCKFNGTSTLAINDSFNVSSVSDVGSGNYTPNFTNNMVNEHFCAHATKRNESTNTGAQIQIPSYSSSSNNMQMHESDSATDSSAVSHSVRGDLA